MAEVSIIWTGLDQLSKVADGVTESVRGTGKAAEESSGLFDGLGAKITGLGTSLAGAGLAAGGAAILGIGKAALDVAGDINRASNDIAAQLGIPKEAAEGFEDVMKGVFANNFGESFEDIGAGVVVLDQRLGDLIDTQGEAGQKALESAFAIRDAFGPDTAESLDAVQTLMEQFGLTSDEAFDFVAAGFQKGLDRSGDFLDSIGEYATQFGSAGADASEFFSLLESGAAGGVLGTDKAADAFKEFRVRIQDGSTATTEALQAIGINSDLLFEQMSDGTVTAVEAFDQVLGALRGVDDQNVLMQAGVGLLGTQFEDLGQDAVLALSTTQTSIEDLAGSTDALNQQYDNLGAVFEGVKRQALVAIAPIGDALLEVANLAMPAVSRFMTETLQPAFGAFAEGLPGKIDQIGEKFIALRDAISGIFSLFLEGDFTAEFGRAFGVFEDDEIVGNILSFRQTVIDTLEAVQGMVGIGDVFSGIGEAVSSFVELSGVIDLVRDNMAPFEGALKGAGIAIAALVGAAGLQLAIGAFTALASLLAGPVIAALGLVLSPIGLVIAGAVALGAAWETNFLGIRDVTNEAIGPITEKIGGFLESIKSLSTGDFSKVGELLRAGLGEALEFLGPTIENFKEGFAGFAEAIGPAFDPIINDLIPKIRDEFIPILDDLILILDDLAKIILGTVVVAFTGLANFIAGAMPGIGTAIVGAVEIGVGALTLIADTVEGVVEIISALLSGEWQQAWDAAGELVSDVADNIGQVLDGAATLVMGIITGLVGGIVTAFQGLWDTLVGNSIIPDMVSDILSAFTGFASEGLEIIGGLVSGMVSAFEDVEWGKLGNSVKDGILGGLGGLKEAGSSLLSDAAGGIQGAWNRRWGNKSPSQWMQDSAKDIIAGLVIGFEQHGDEPVIALNKIFDDASKVVNDRIVPKWMEDSARSIIDGLNAGIKENGSLTIDAIDLMLKAIHDFVDSDPRDIHAAFASVIGGLTTGIKREAADSIIELNKIFDEIDIITNDRFLQSLGTSQALGGRTGITLPGMDNSDRFMRSLGTSMALGGRTGITMPGTNGEIGQTWNVTINSNAPVSTIRSDIEMLRALSGAA